jgi:CHAT domain-containing protein
MACNLQLRMRFAGILTLLVAASAASTAQSGPLQQQIDQQEQKLAAARTAQDARAEAVELNTLANLYRQIGKPQKALDDCNQALALEQTSIVQTGTAQAGSVQAGVALTRNLMGRVYTDLGDEQQALDLFNQALPIWLALGSRLGQATTLNGMGRAYNDLGQREKALDLLNQALPLWREVGSRAGEASTLDNLGKTYTDMGHAEQALPYFNQALPIWREVGERGGEALSLTNLGRAYADLGRKQDALESFKQALAIWRDLGNRQGEALTLNSIGRLYRDLGQQPTALDYYNQALPIWREVDNRNGEALALNDIGSAHAYMGQTHKALDYFSQALAIWRETGNRRGEATTLTDIGWSDSDLGQAQKALDTDTQALSIWREVEDRRGQALALMMMGRAWFQLKYSDRALVSDLAALSLAQAAADPDMEGNIQAALMYGFHANHLPQQAILFGLEAVNSYQQIRRNIGGLDKDLQTGFVQSKSSTYRMLAELLVDQDRLGEAEQVLDLLKEQELKEVVRGAGESAGAATESLSLNAAQQKAAGDLESSEKSAAALTDMSVEYATLQAKSSRTPEEDARMKTLEANIETQNGEVADLFRKTIFPELAQTAGTANANLLLSAEKSDVSQLQNTLAQLGPHVLGIRLLLGQDHAYAIVVTAQARKRFELKATPAELRDKVLEVRNELRTPESDPRPHPAELYAMVVAPFAPELDALERQPPNHGQVDHGRAPTLLWSLDGVLRYLPMAALYDGHRYMVERFNNILFTPESYGHMTTSAGKPDLRVLAMGLSKSYGGLPALPGVMPELESVAHDPSIPESHGPLDGLLLPDEHFTYDALKIQLGAGTGFPVVHIASHFVLDAGGGAEPYLMLAGESASVPEGFELTLSKLEDSTITFHGTRLLTLSACSTAKGDVANDGLEMDSLGMVAQQKDAEAVLATLWDVNDLSTSRIMSDFYARWVSNPTAGKAEALRQAQLALLHGTGLASQTTTGRGLQPEESPRPASHLHDYAHPFYWAPFVLIGNYQ